MIWWDLRRLLRDLARAADRWRLVEAIRRPGEDQWRAIAADGDTGLWHTLDAYTDLTVARPIPPLGVLPTAAGTVTPIARPEGRPLHDGGRLAWGALLAARAAAAGSARPHALPGPHPRPARGGGPPGAVDRLLGRLGAAAR